MADVSKVIINGNTVFDLTGVTVTPDKLAKGVTAHDKSGEKIVGTATAGSTLYDVVEYTASEIGSSSNNPTALGTAVDKTYTADPSIYHGYSDGGNLFCAAKIGTTVLLYTAYGCNLNGGTSLISDSTYYHYLKYSSGTKYKIVRYPSEIAPKDVVHGYYAIADFGGEDMPEAYMPLEVDTDGIVYITPFCDWTSGDVPLLQFFVMYDIG